jgi:hypothetical protein
MIGDKFGYIDQTGQVVIEPAYSNAYWFQEGLAPVEKNEKWGTSIRLGTWLFPFSSN